MSDNPDGMTVLEWLAGAPVPGHPPLFSEGWGNIVTHASVACASSALELVALQIIRTVEMLEPDDPRRTGRVELLALRARLWLRQFDRDRRRQREAAEALAIDWPFDGPQTDVDMGDRRSLILAEADDRAQRMTSVLPPIRRWAWPYELGRPGRWSENEVVAEPAVFPSDYDVDLEGDPYELGGAFKPGKVLVISADVVREEIRIRYPREFSRHHPKPDPAVPLAEVVPFPSLRVVRE